MRFLRSKWRKLKRFFAKTRPMPSHNPIGDDVVDNEIQRRNEGAHRVYKKVALVRGHSDASSGCASYATVMPNDFPDRPSDLLKRREYDITAYVFKKVKEFIDLDSFSMTVQEFLRDGKSIGSVGRDLEKFKPDLVLAGHKNSVGHNSDVEGREILIQEKYKGTFVEQEGYRMIRLMAHFIGESPLRGEGRKGIRWTERKMRGDYNLDVYDDCYPKCTMLLEEDFIGKATPTARQLLSGEGLNNNARAIAYFCLGYDVIGGELVL